MDFLNSRDEYVLNAVKRSQRAIPDVRVKREDGEESIHKCAYFYTPEDGQVTPPMP